MNKMELLAPAGDMESLIAAVENGADAVYFGGRLFGARFYATNISDDEIERAIDFCHVRDVKTYITVNTLIKDDELGAAFDFIVRLYRAGADAIIIQDLGLTRMIRREYGDLPLHGSTQMTIHNLEGARLLEEMGFKRVVLSRELTHDEIRRIRDGSRIELEVFVHGALCICYSGQCLMSSLIGGRSGNRGRCAQPCRLEYEFECRGAEDEAADRNGDAKDYSTVNGKGDGRRGSQSRQGYLLSPKDLRLIEHVPELDNCGVTSLKIEGRMKRPEYVASVVRIYREALDRYYDDPDNYSAKREWIDALEQIFNSGAGPGYFLGNPGGDLMSYNRPNNRGMFLGRIESYNSDEKRARMRIETDLHRDDGIEVWVSDGGRVGTTIDHLYVGGKEVESAEKDSVVEFAINGRIYSGDRVFKNYDAELMREARKSFLSPRATKKIPIRMFFKAGIGEPIRLRVEDNAGNRASSETGYIVEKAIKRPATADQVKEQLNRLGNSPFEAVGIDVEMDEGVMLPLSELNKVRREALAELERQRAERYKRDCSKSRMKIREKAADDAFGAEESQPDKKPLPVDKRPLLTAMVNEQEILKSCVDHVDEIYLLIDPLKGRDRASAKDGLKEAASICHGLSKRLYLHIPAIIEPFETDGILGIVDEFREDVDGFVIGNLGLLSALKGEGLNLVADYNLNLFNHKSIEFIMDMGVKRACLSLELNLDEIGKLARKARGSGDLSIEILAHGSMPMMVTRHCIPGSLIGGRRFGRECSRPCRKSGCRFILKDRKGLEYSLLVDSTCHTHIFNPKDLCMVEHVGTLIRKGIDVLRMSFLGKSGEYSSRVAATYRSVLERVLEGLEGSDRSESFEPEREQLEALSPQGITKGHFFRGVE